MSERGTYTVIEGGDGVGKSTVVELLARRNHLERGVRTFTLEEPDSIKDESGKVLVPTAEALRVIIKAKEFGRSALTNVLLFNASRRENLLQGIEPALAAGIDIFAARNFESTTVYQGFGEGWDLDEIWKMVLEATSEEYMHPDHTFILDLPDQARADRLANANRGSNTVELDTFESRPTDFQIRINEGYRKLSELRGYPLISALPVAEVVAEEIWQKMHTTAQ